MCITYYIIVIGPFRDSDLIIYVLYIKLFVYICL